LALYWCRARFHPVAKATPQKSAVP